MNNYEGVFMFYPNVDEEARDRIFDRVKGIVEAEGSIDEIDEWGMRQLAYEIEDFREAYYRVVKFKATPETLNEVERILRISDSVMRHLMIRLEDE